MSMSEGCACRTGTLCNTWRSEVGGANGYSDQGHDGVAERERARFRDGCMLGCLKDSCSE